MVALARAGAAAAVIDATGLAPTDAHAAWLDAALQTATVNRLAASVMSWDRPVEVPFDRAAWRRAEVAS
jgi:hypothetical protein